MFGIGMPEMILILAVALIVIGPKKLPDLAKSLGQALGEFRKATRELKDTLEIESDLAAVKDTFDDVQTYVDENNESVEIIEDSSTDTTEPFKAVETKDSNSDSIQKEQKGSLNND